MSEYAYEHCPLYSARDKLIQGFTVNNDALKDLKYRWEFLRRNEGYKKDYSTSLKEVKGFRELKWLSETGFAELAFCKRWRIGVPVLPRKSFPKLRKEVEKEVNESISFYKSSLQQTLGNINKEQFVRLFLESILKPVDYFLPPIGGWEEFLFTEESDILTIKNKQYTRFAKKGEVNFTINFHYTQQSIMDDLDKIVRLFKRKHKHLKKEGMELYKKLEDDDKKGKGDKIKLNRIKQIIKAQKTTEQQFKAQRVIPRDRKYDVKQDHEYLDDYLKVWDLREKKVGWKEIAKHISPDDFPDPAEETDSGAEPENAERRARRYYDNAKILISKMGLDFTIFNRTEPYSF